MSSSSKKTLKFDSLLAVRMASQMREELEEAAQSADATSADLMRWAAAAIIVWHKKKGRVPRDMELRPLSWPQSEE
ncbi:hypothetical protein OH491_10880 [Termitidicoccus mucosus]|uniref:hypothetical protein n=1 Tax=Termitidicoccus mucosus TaxID=1184151 RepID=UPI0011AB3558